MIRTTIQELGKVITGHTPPTSKHEYFGNSYPFLKPTDMIIGQKYTYATEEGYSDLAASKYKSSLVPKGSTCVVCIGTLGEKMSMAHCDLFTNQSVNSIVPDERYDQHYVYYLLKHNLHRVKALNKGTASGREFVSKSTFLELEIDVIEDKTKQIKISQILSAYDDLIDNNHKQLQLLKEAAKRLYKEWFVYFRYPGHEKEAIADGLPVGWSRVKVTDLLEIKYGKDHKALLDGDTPVYGSGGIMRKVQPVLYSGESVLIPRKGSLNNILFVEGDFWTIDTMFYSIPRMNNVAKYAYIHLCGLDMYSYNIGSAVPSMTTKILSGMDIILPSETVLQLFEETITPIFKRMKCLEIQNETAAEARDRLLPKLITGEIEL